MARILPEWNVSLFGHFSFSLNPGPWSVKEHLLGTDDGYFPVLNDVLICACEVVIIAVRFRMRFAGYHDLV
jgi:hypothetical protein